MHRSFLENGVMGCRLIGGKCLLNKGLLEGATQEVLFVLAFTQLLSPHNTLS